VKQPSEVVRHGLHSLLRARNNNTAFIKILYQNICYNLSNEERRLGNAGNVSFCKLTLRNLTHTFLFSGKV